MLTYDPHSADDYRPLMRWAGHLLHGQSVDTPVFPRRLESALQGIPQIALMALWDTPRMPGVWVSVDITAPPAVAVQLQHTLRSHVDKAALYLGSMLRGVAPWYAAGLHWGVHRLVTDAVPRRLLDKAGSLRRLDRMWASDPEVRSCYQSDYFDGTLLFGPEYWLVEVPLVQAFLSKQRGVAARKRMRDAAAILLADVAERTNTVLSPCPPFADPLGERRVAIQTVQRVHYSRAYVEGTIHPYDDDTVEVERLVGDPGMAALGQQLVHAAISTSTRVRVPADDQLLEVLVPPTYRAQTLELFNTEYANHPHRLFSLEVRRLQSVVESLTSLLKDPSEPDALTRATAMLESDNGRLVYFCDPMPWCTQPLPHIWETGNEL